VGKKINKTRGAERGNLKNPKKFPSSRSYLNGAEPGEGGGAENRGGKLGLALERNGLEGPEREKRGQQNTILLKIHVAPQRKGGGGTQKKRGGKNRQGPKNGNKKQHTFMMTKAARSAVRGLKGNAQRLQLGEKKKKKRPKGKKNAKRRGGGEPEKNLIIEHVVRGKTEKKVCKKKIKEACKRRLNAHKVNNLEAMVSRV